MSERTGPILLITTAAGALASFGAGKALASYATGGIDPHHARTQIATVAEPDASRSWSAGATGVGDRWPVAAP